MKNVKVRLALTLGVLAWLIIVWGLITMLTRSNAPEPANHREINKAVLLAIMTKRNSRNPKEFTVEKVAVVRNTVCMTYSGQNALGEHTAEQVLMENNSNQPWYSAQEGFIDRWVKYCTHKGDDITDVVTANLPRFEAALKAREDR